MRTLCGSGLLAAGVAAVVGILAMFGGIVAFLLLGSFMYFLASPFLLYFAYILLGSDVRSLGEGLARAPASAATVGYCRDQS